MSTRSSDAGRAAPARATGGKFVVAPGAVAPVGRRALAYGVDVVLLVLVYVAGSALPPGASGPALVAVGLCLVVAVGQWLAESFTGATVGGALLGIRTVSVRTGRPAGVLAILVRQLVVGVGALACLVGQLVVVVSGVWDTTPSQRGWHDKAAGTLVLRAASVPLAAGGAPGPASAWDDAVARAVGHPGGLGVAPRPTGLTPEPPLAPEPPRVAPEPLHLAPEPPGWGAVPASEAGSPVPLVPISRAPRTPPSAPLPERGDTAPAAPMIDVPDGIRPRAVEQPVAPEVIGAPPTGPAPTAPVPLATGPVPTGPLATRSDASPPPAGLVQGPPPAVRSRRDLRVEDGRPVPQAPPPAPDLGDLELTRLRPAAAPAPAAAATGVRLVFDTGERLDVVGDGLVGRSPSAEDQVEHVVAIDDPARSISKVHLAFGPTPDGGLWVMDRGSTNGTVLVGPDGGGAVLPPGTRVTALVGSTVRFGQRSVRVERG